MTDTAADTGYGVILKKESSPSSGTYNDYGLELTSVNGIGFSRSSQDATHMQSPDEHTEFVHGLMTTKPITCEVNWLPSSTGALQTLQTTGKVNWRIQFPDNSTLTVRAALTDLDVGALTPDGKMTASFVLTPSGKGTWA